MGNIRRSTFAKISLSAMLIIFIHGSKLGEWLMYERRAQCNDNVLNHFYFLLFHWVYSSLCPHFGQYSASSLLRTPKLRFTLRHPLQKMLNIFRALKTEDSSSDSSDSLYRLKLAISDLRNGNLPSSSLLMISLIFFMNKNSLVFAVITLLTCLN